MPTAEFTQEDLERFDDRLAHAEQYMAETLKALRECRALAERAGQDNGEDADQ